MLPYSPTPIQEIKGHPLLKRAEVSVFVKREDLNHPTVSGNKWWKLKFNLEEALRSSHQTIVTLGGAYSNHIYATAAAAAALGLKAIGIIRGNEIKPLNPTLSFAQQKGMELRFVSREKYKRKNSPEFLQELKSAVGEFLFLPEGGSNLLAVNGCASFVQEELSKINFDNLFLPVGTGATMAGLICGFRGKKRVTGVSVLKGGAFLEGDIRKFVAGYSGTSFENWRLITHYHHGGYAKTTPELHSFITEMNDTYSLPLDHVYTGKLLWAVFKEIEAGAIARGEKILVLHTGGLQGLS